MLCQYGTESTLMHIPRIRNSNPGKNPCREKLYWRKALDFVTPMEKTPTPFKKTVDKSPLPFFFQTAETLH